MTRVTIPERFMARSLRLELERQRLVVALVPGLTGRIRCAVESNPQWYRRLCSRYESNRRDRARWRRWKTSIKRRETLWALAELARGEVRGVYGPRVLAVVREEIEAQRARYEHEATAWRAGREAAV